jgi:hypothetical protein
MSSQKTLPKTEVGVPEGIDLKELSLHYQSEKHCLKGDELGNVTIYISHRKSPQMGLINITLVQAVPGHTNIRSTPRCKRPV